MFECERCGSSYNASHIGVEHCPRCRLRDRVQAPLAFKAFQLPESQSAMAPEISGGVEAVSTAPTKAPG
jgi:hypothetical protein